MYNKDGGEAHLLQELEQTFKKVIAELLMKHIWRTDMDIHREYFYCLLSFMPYLYNNTTWFLFYIICSFVYIICFLPMSTFPYSLQDICPSFMPRRLLTYSVGRVWTLGQAILCPDLRSIPKLLCDPVCPTPPFWFVSVRRIYGPHAARGPAERFSAHSCKMKIENTANTEIWVF